MKTAQGVSPSVSATDIWISIVVFGLVFVVLGVADTWLMLRYGRRDLGHDPLAKVTTPEGGQDPHASSGSSHEDDSFDSFDSSHEDDSMLVY
jgi:hypothetical protein